MRIGIDISQTAFENTGVSMYLESLLESLVKIDSNNEYILFFSSLRKNLNPKILNLANHKNVKIKIFKIPPTILDFVWNKVHILPLEWLVGNVDLFITSDWAEPPSKIKKATILYDLVIYKYPEETDKKIIAVQKRRLQWVKKECDVIFCISQSTKKDAIKILGIEEKRLNVIYPGI